MNTNNTEDKKTLLLVDDDATFCRVLAKALEKRSFDVFTATELATGLELAADHRPDYAIIDLRIGHESGLELVEKLHTQNPDLRMLMLTSYASISTAVEAIKLGAVHYLTKPATVEDIINALQRESGMGISAKGAFGTRWQYFCRRTRVEYAPSHPATKTGQATS